MLIGIAFVALSLVMGFGLAAALGSGADRARVVVANRTEPGDLRRWVGTRR